MGEPPPVRGSVKSGSSASLDKAERWLDQQTLFIDPDDLPARTCGRCGARAERLVGARPESRLGRAGELNVHCVSHKAVVVLEVASERLGCSLQEHLSVPRRPAVRAGMGPDPVLFEATHDAAPLARVRERRGIAGSCPARSGWRASQKA